MMNSKTGEMLMLYLEYSQILTHMHYWFGSVQLETSSAEVRTVPELAYRGWLKRAAEGHRVASSRLLASSMR